MKHEIFIPVCVCLVSQACPILWDPMQCSPPVSSVHGNSPGKNSEQDTMPSFRGSSQPRDWTRVSYTADRSREAPPLNMEHFMNLCVIISSSVQFSRSVTSDSLRPHGLKHIRLPITNSWSLFKCMSIESLTLSHPLSSPSPPRFNLSQHQSLFQWVSSSHQVAKVLNQGKILEDSQKDLAMYNKTTYILTFQKFILLQP